ncbi:NADPH:quinone oxidoreductase family protein [Roseomonas sp. SSH11]|uniref:NADPH:quinone oxidoreductase family protein n=1 Tax=Pararoseomonas baculiformis TaxID=2820812 RepID=A0ABS4A9Z6_9PROT|nr:NADPH:quinone oxidoreductase family protein [Pararoseomonas baculiformis]MBP0443812.1 NADPH:quinone oxidoreductase family protein [Pararoseomonas baculiformis]
MKAVLCREYGPASTLRVETVPDPRPGPGQVLLRVEACGVNFPDTLIIEGRYQQKPPMPFVPGGEVCGVVTAQGEGVSEPAIGARVAAVITYGGFAEAVAVDAAKAVPVPPGVSPEAAAALGLAYGTVLHALEDRGALVAGETLLVLGASGGVGMAAIQLGKILGARVIAAASSAEKLEACRGAGADGLVDYSAEGWREQLRSLTEGRGPDVIFDPVGSPYTEPALRSIAWRGRYLVVGFAAGEIPRLPLNLVLLKNCAVTGVFYGEFTRREPAANRALLSRLFGWVAEGRLRPAVSQCYPLEGAAEALEALAGRRATGKLVLLTHAARPG